MSALWVLQIVFLVLKLGAIVNWGWGVIMLPLMIWFALIVLASIFSGNEIR